jgi:peroxiredoxin
MSDNSNTSISEIEGYMNTLKNKNFPNISLPNQDGNLLNLNRLDTFRMVLYFYPMTGRP